MIIPLTEDQLKKILNLHLRKKYKRKVKTYICTEYYDSVGQEIYANCTFNIRINGLKTHADYSLTQNEIIDILNDYLKDYEVKDIEFDEDNPHFDRVYNVIVVEKEKNDKKGLSLKLKNKK